MLPLPWQYAFTYAPQRNICAVNGVATGKTTIVAIKGDMKCKTIPYYRFLNTSITAKQAELPFVMLQEWISVNKDIERHIKDISLRPYPVIEYHNGSVAEFRTHGVDGRNIRGFEYDQINHDEGGFEYTGEVRKVLRRRLRGTRPDGTEREAQFSITTTPTEAIWLREMFDRGWPGHATFDRKNFYSWRVSTWDNTFLPPDQIEQMTYGFSDAEVDIEMRGLFPDYGLSEFPSKYVTAITTSGSRLYDEAYSKVNPTSGVPDKGYALEEHPRHGIVKYEKPLDPSGIYVLAGDPGVGMLPARNAGVVGVERVDVTPSELVYFHWIDGYGSYDPFLASFDYANKKYRCYLKLMDTTGTGKAIGDLAFERFGIEVDPVSFSSTKDELINALILDVTNQTRIWPPIRGLIRQMSLYRRADDKDLAQDIVMMMGLLSYGKVYVPRKIAVNTKTSIDPFARHRKRGRTNVGMRRHRKRARR